MSTQSLQNMSLLVYNCNVPPIPCPRPLCFLRISQESSRSQGYILAKINLRYTAFSTMLGLKGDTTVHTEHPMR